MANETYLSEGFDANLNRTPNSPTQQGGLMGRTFADDLNFDPLSGETPLIARPVSSENPNVFSLNFQTPNDIKNGIPPRAITLDRLVIDQLGITDYISSVGFETGVQGWIIRGSGDVEFNDGVFRGSISASTIDIGGSDATSFHVDVDGNMWLGAANLASAPFSVTNAGVVDATSGTIGGFSIGDDYIRDAADSFGLASTITGGDDVRFWAGTTFSNRSSAPFRITEAGDITAGTGATISTDTGFKNRLYNYAPLNFTNPNNIETSNNSYATATTATSQIFAGFDFNIPNNATIVGIEATLEGHDDHGGGTAATARVQLSHDEGTTFTNQSAYTMTMPDTTDSTTTFGGAAYLWGRTWTVNEFLESNFRAKVEIVAMNSATTVSFDHLQVKVHYTYTSQLTYDGTDISVAGGTITGGKIASATSGARIEMTTRGLRSYDGNGDKRIEIGDDQITFLLGTSGGYGFAGKIYTDPSASIIVQPAGSGVAAIVNPELFQRYTGWVSANDTWTYASATTFTVSGDRTDRIGAGTKLRFVQTTTKYLYALSASYNGGSDTTTVTVINSNDYSLANAAITLPYYSHESSPIGFPQWFSKPGSGTGFDPRTVDVLVFNIEAGKVSCWVDIEGTSNATTLTFTGPAPAQRASVTTLAQAIDSGVSSVGRIDTAAGSSTISAYKNAAADAWTASGSKAALGYFWYELDT